jgi:DNA-binding transcriptional regulator of glucitol operon
MAMENRRVKDNPQTRRDVIVIICIILCMAWMAILTAITVSKFNSQTKKINDQAAGLAKVVKRHGHLAEKIVDSAIAGCQRQNIIRKTLRENLQEDIEQSHSTNYEKFFPNIPPDKLHRLIHRENVKSRERIKELARQKCRQLFPQSKPHLVEPR